MVTVVIWLTGSMHPASFWNLTVLSLELIVTVLAYLC